MLMNKPKMKTTISSSLLVAACASCTAPNPLITDGSKWELRLESATGERAGQVNVPVADANGDAARETICVCLADEERFRRGTAGELEGRELDWYNDFLEEPTLEVIAACNQLVQDGGYTFDPTNSDHVTCRESARDTVPEQVEGGACPALRSECYADWAAGTGGADEDGDGGSTGADSTSGGDFTTGVDVSDDGSQIVGDSFGLAASERSYASAGGGDFGYDGGAADGSGDGGGVDPFVGPEEFGLAAWSDAITPWWGGYIVAIDAGLADQIRADPTKLMFAEGSSVGFSTDPPGLMVHVSEADSLTDALGLQDDDVITSIGGLEVGTLEQAVEAFTDFSGARGYLQITFERAGRNRVSYLYLP